MDGVGGSADRRAHRREIRDRVGSAGYAKGLREGAEAA